MAFDPLWSLSASKIRSMLRNRTCSAVEVTESCLQRIMEREPIVKAFVDLDSQGALRSAEELDHSDISGALHGIPIAVKDTIDVAGLHCTLGTEIHRDRIPLRDAEVVRRLRCAGAVILGTTVSTEYAIARAGPTTNPYDASRTPGGSSSGSAAAVAARMVPIAIGTQTVGSIVRPSTYCGIFGYKPPMNAISTTGVMTLSPFLDHVGPMSRSLDDVFLAYRSMRNGEDERKPTTKLPRIALLVDGPFRDRIEPPSQQALARATSLLESSGVTIVPAELPVGAGQAKHCWETILYHDLAVHHGADRDQFGSRMSDRLKKIIDDGREITDRAYEAALVVARTIRAHVLELLLPDRIILAPAVDGVAPPFSDSTGASDLQGLWSLAGVAALAVPCGEVRGLPIGVQLIAHPLQEYFMHGVGRLFESLRRQAD